ncbi:penicillin-binding protein 2 [Candidatus Saccharibacteria bacterium]|nr:penicillin-binding protein 2 [Candidatus Saccharibacteria bacterium]
MKLELQKGSRSRILAVLVLGVMAVFVVRLFYLQVIQHGYYSNLADNEQIKRLTIPAKRGLIYALDGDKPPVQLVMNETIYTVFADPQTTKDDSKIVDVIRRIAGGNARADLSGLLARKDSRYQILATKITRTQADKIKQEGLRGIGFQQESQRVYPEGSLAAQTLGFVDFSGNGRYGVEGKLNDRLLGRDGLLQSVTDVSDVPLTIGNRNINKPAVDGENIVLSIDRNVQSYVDQALAAGLKRTGATNGSVMVMDPQSGKIMAMANFPTYKPAEFNKVEDGEVFNNGTISKPYEPGSVIKTLTVATGIDKGVITPQSTYVNTDLITIGGEQIRNATKGQTGTITIQHALNWSLNTGMVTVAQRLGDGTSINRSARDIMYDYFYNKFGLGQFSGIELSGEASGIVWSPEALEGNAVRYSNMSFGQGMDLTMVQVCSAFSSIVNGGKYYKPTVLAGVVDTSGTYKPRLTQPLRTTISPSTSAQVKEMTRTARAMVNQGIDRPGYVIGGKTGTSEVPDKNGGYLENETVGTYLGYGGEDAPAYVIMIQVSGKNVLLQGGRDAMPIFADISNWMIDYLKLQPKG